MKKCPYCAEDVRDEAVVCRFCGRDLHRGLDETPTQPASSGRDPCDLDARSDIYSFGVVLCECLSGRTPFTHGDISKQICGKRPTDLAGVPDYVNAEVQCLLAKRTADRPATAEALLGRLRKRPRPAPSLSPPPSWQEQTLTVDLGGEATTKMVLIPAGTFTTGSPASEESRDDDEVQHEVTISRPFYMGIHEVTQDG